ncbi:MAG: YfhO family protein [Oscillospiraceae bacterium]|nr:YfhO family protein [Oscillospiraceae bacterium]
MERIRKNFYLKAFILGFLTAFCLFLPYLVIDKGFFTYAGDFNSQQIPFYMYMNRMVKSGSLSWGWAIDLGSSVVNSYSFYLLGSPFFWLSCLFPYKRIPYVMPYLLMLKFAVGNVGAFGYLRRYARSDNMRLVGALLYTFCGFSIYNIFFNHFIESVVFFPYLIWALDEYMYNDRKAVFPLIVALNLVNNYFFFIGQVIFLFIYFICKTVSKEYSFTARKFWNLAFESVLGCIMGMILFIPSRISVMQNPRAIRFQSGFGFWMYGTVQQYFAILSSALLPPDPPYIPSLFTSGAIKWTSMSAFVALGGLFGYFVFLRHNRRSSFFKIFTVCIVAAFVPVFNSSFYALNSSYYARWYYMPVMMLVAMNIQSFAMDKDKIVQGLKTTAILTAVLLVFGLTPIKNENGFFIGLADQVAIYWVNMLIAFLSLYITYVLVRSFIEKSDYTQKLMSGAIGLIMLFGILHMGLTKMPQWNRDKLYRPQNYDVLDTFGFDDYHEDFRMDAFNCYDNLGLFTGIPCIQFFNSTVSPSIMSFYPEVGVKRDVSSKPPHSNYALRSLLSVKYVVMPNWEEENFIKEATTSTYTRRDQYYPYTVYVNDYFIPMGFAYDMYVDEDLISIISPGNRSIALLRAIYIDEELIDKYDLPLVKIDEDTLYDYTFETFTTDVMKRRNMSSQYFKMRKDGFDCQISLKQGNLVFFSVPYDEGFTAYVNGEKAEIEKVNYGLCAVYAPAGDNQIEFRYRTPYLNAGIAASLFGFLVWGIYMIMSARKKTAGAADSLRNQKTADNDTEVKND